MQVKESVMKYLNGKTTTAIEWSEARVTHVALGEFLSRVQKRFLKPIITPEHKLAILFYGTPTRLIRVRILQRMSCETGGEKQFLSLKTSLFSFKHLRSTKCLKYRRTEV